VLAGGLRTKAITKQAQKNKPLVTVVTAVRNAEGTLEETILSVIHQTYKNVEYIIIDGASTDNTLNIIGNYENKIDYWMSEPDNGIYYAMNKGIAQATGEWINFMNSGDSFYSNDCIEKFMELYDTQSEVVYGDGQFFYDFGVYINRCTTIKYDYMPNCHQAFFVKSHLLKNNYFDTNYRICADKKFFYDVYKSGYRYQHISLVVCNYELITGFSSLAKNRKKLFSETAEIEGINKSTRGKIRYLIYIVKNHIKSIMPRKIYVWLMDKKLLSDGFFKTSLSQVSPTKSGVSLSNKKHYQDGKM